MQYNRLIHVQRKGKRGKGGEMGAGFGEVALLAHPTVPLHYGLCDNLPGPLYKRCPFRKTRVIVTVI